VTAAQREAPSKLALTTGANLLALVNPAALPMEMRVPGPLFRVIRPNAGLRVPRADLVTAILGEGLMT